MIIALFGGSLLSSAYAHEVIPALVLTGATELFAFVPIGTSGSILPLCSGDMLFNVFDEYLGVLSDGI